MAKGLEPGTGKRMSEVYAEEIGHDRVVAMGGPCLASGGRAGPARRPPCWPRPTATGPRRPPSSFAVESFRVAVTDDVAGVEYCTVAKNVAAIGMGILDGLGKVAGLAYSNARAAMFTLAVAELAS